MSTELLEWVERLGGWAVVCFICWWMMRRSDSRDVTLQRALEKLSDAVDQIVDIERSNTRDHERIMEKLDQLK